MISDSNLSVFIAGNDSESSEGEDDDAEQPEAYKGANCRTAGISEDVHYDSIARMPYRSRNPVYSPTPPLHDTHNDSGYSTRMYGSSKGASPSLSGVFRKAKFHAINNLSVSFILTIFNQE